MKFPNLPRKGMPVVDTIREIINYIRSSRVISINGVSGAATSNGTTFRIPLGINKQGHDTKPPLWVTLRSVPATPPTDPPTWEVYAEYGHVVPRHNASGETGAPVGITSLPTHDAPLAVIEDDKLWVKLTISNLGTLTAALWESGTNWPNDSPPSLSGGDSVGSAGTRYVRIAEIIANPDSTSTPPSLIREQLLTGHIDHFQPVLCDNVVGTYSTGEGGLPLKLWSAALGRWLFRGIKKGKGQLTITQDGDEIEVRGNKKKGKITYTIGAGSPVDLVPWVDGLMTQGATEEDPAAPVAATAYNIPIPSAYVHPWKVTDGGGGNAAIAAGFVLGYYLYYPDALPDSPPAADGVYAPDDVTLLAGSSYAGGNAAVTGTQYIYAEIPRNGATSEYAESLNGSDTSVLVELSDDIEPSFSAGAPTDTATIVVSSTAPGLGGYVPTTGKAAICIAKVTNAAGVITVDAQYVTHNPPLFLPLVRVLAVALP